MPNDFKHVAGIREVTPSALGCEECLKMGSPWVHLRLCRTQRPCRIAAMIHPTGTRPSIFTGRVIPLSRDTIRRKDGVGAMSTRS